MWSNEGRSSELEGRGVCAAVAVDKDKNSQYAVKWAIEKLDLMNNNIILIHVKSTQSDNQDISIDGRMPTQSEARQLFLPYRSMCARKGIQAQEVILQDLDIAEALCEYASVNSVTTIVLGASSGGALLRAFKGVDVPTSVGKCAPDCCEVYAISKSRVMKLKSSKEPSSIAFSSESTRPARYIHSDSSKYTVSDAPSADGHSQPSVLSSEINSSPLREFSRENQQTVSRRKQSLEDLNESFFEELFHSSSNQVPLDSSAYGSNGNKELRGMAPSDGRHQRINRIHETKKDMKQLNFQIKAKEGNPSNSGFGSGIYSQEMNSPSDVSLGSSNKIQVSDSSMPSNPSQTAELEAELRRLKQEIQQITEKYNAARQDASFAEDKVKGIFESKLDESNPDEAEDVEETAIAIVELAQKAQKIADLELDKQKHFETEFKQAAEEKQKAMDELTFSGIQCRRYTREEIEAATNHFSDANKIGEGGFGFVYKATLDHTPVAIKVLKPDMSQGRIQFQREVEVLSCMRHPHMVILLGACPENGCLVYEYMDNGSLEDRLFRKDGTLPIPWPTRFRIAKEIATALNFLHRMRPEPLVHRDLKPANILLDGHYVSKISDVGLARLVPPSAVGSVTEYHMTAAAGTFCYIDPEYQQTGMLGTKSDIYSLGVLLLQIITARSPMGLTHKVERAIEKGRFSEILDPTVKDWPVEEALSFAKLSLKCCELRKKDRPDLNTEILPELARLSNLGAKIAHT